MGREDPVRTEQLCEAWTVDLPDSGPDALNQPTRARIFALLADRREPRDPLKAGRLVEVK
jgi:hypothetical protein